MEAGAGSPGEGVQGWGSRRGLVGFVRSRVAEKMFSGGLSVDEVFQVCWVAVSFARSQIPVLRVAMKKGGG